jgi:hypothetical protein
VSCAVVAKWRNAQPGEVDERAEHLIRIPSRTAELDQIWKSEPISYDQLELIEGEVGGEKKGRSWSSAPTFEIHSPKRRFMMFVD